MAKAPVKRSTASSAPQSMILQLKEAFDTGTDEEKQAMREMFPGVDIEWGDTSMKGMLDEDDTVKF